MAVVSVGLDVIGLLLNVLQFIGIAPNAVPQTPVLSSGNSLVRIAVGLDTTPIPGLSTFGGDEPNIKLYNENLVELGSYTSSGKQIQNGTFRDFVVSQNGNNQQPRYLEVMGGQSGICIAYIWHIWPDSTQRMWLGDMGHYCANFRSWISGIQLATQNGSMHTPYCVWVGSNATDQDQLLGFRLDMSAFSGVSSDSTISGSEPSVDVCWSPFTLWYTPNSTTNPVYQAISERQTPYSLLILIGIMSLVAAMMTCL